MGVEDSNKVVDNKHDKDEDLKACVISIVWRYHSIPVHRKEKHIKATHNKEYENTAKMHSCIGSIYDPEVYQLKHSCHLADHYEFSYTNHYLPII